MMVKSDGGNEFKGVFDAMCAELGIRHHVTLPYHPQGNGMAERFVRTVKGYLIRYLATTDTTVWESMLP